MVEGMHAIEKHLVCLCCEELSLYLKSSVRFSKRG